MLSRSTVSGRLLRCLDTSFSPFPPVLLLLPGSLLTKISAQSQGNHRELNDPLFRLHFLNSRIPPPSVLGLWTSSARGYQLVVILFPLTCMSHAVSARCASHQYGHSCSGHPPESSFALQGWMPSLHKSLRCSQLPVPLHSGV
jgi:hypothetical protein